MDWFYDLLRISEYLPQMVGQEGQPPPGSGPAPHDREQDDVVNLCGDQSMKATQASKVTGSKTERMKLNVLDRKYNSVSYNLSKEELAKLLLKKMTIDPKSAVKVDTSGSPSRYTGSTSVMAERAFSK